MDTHHIHVYIWIFKTLAAEYTIHDQIFPFLKTTRRQQQQLYIHYICMFQVFYFLFPSLFIVTNESKQVQWKSSWELIDRPLYNILYKTLCCVVFVKKLIWVTHSVKISSHTGKYIYKHCSRQKITQKQNKKEKPCKYINTLFFYKSQLRKQQQSDCNNT